MSAPLPSLLSVSALTQSPAARPVEWRREDALAAGRDPERTWQPLFDWVDPARIDSASAAGIEAVPDASWAETAVTALATALAVLFVSFMAVLMAYA
jgi:hypothetical protein